MVTAFKQGRASMAIAPDATQSNFETFLVQGQLTEAN